MTCNEEKQQVTELQATNFVEKQKEPYKTKRSKIDKNYHLTSIHTNIIT
jgi:hypothetical protein